MELVNGGDLLEYIHKRERLGTVMLILPLSLFPIDGLQLDEASAQNMTRLLCDALEVRLAHNECIVVALNSWPVVLTSDGCNTSRSQARGMPFLLGERYSVL